MKKYIKHLVALLSCISLNAQQLKLPSITPPSPESSILGSFGSRDIGLFTGTNQQIIPIYTYKTLNLSVPIQLSYRSNGIKVNELNSSYKYGLGWSLSAGGVINREVRGKPDEERMRPIPESLYTNYSDIVSEAEFFDYVGNDAPNDIKDTQADLFNFNFMGKSGKFILGKDLQPIFIDVNGVQIKFISRERFEAVDENGIKYFFNDIETTRRFSTKPGEGILDPGTAHITSWYLSKIVHPNGDEIYFRYNEITNYEEEDIISEFRSIEVKDLQFDYDCQGIKRNNPGFNCDQVYVSEKTQSRLATRKRGLLEIYSNNNNFGRVLFQGSEIIVKHIDERSTTERVIEKVTFTSRMYNNNREFLEKIEFLTPNKTYELEYYSPELLPVRLSRKDDYWGFYNGSFGSFFPNFEDLTTLPVEIIQPLINKGPYTSDKKPNYEYAKFGLLKKIIYPTKGSQEYEYEGNTYYDSERTFLTKHNKGLSVKTYRNEQSKTSIFSLVSDVNQTINFYNSRVSYNNYDCPCDSPNPRFCYIEHHIIADVSVFDLTTNSFVTLRYPPPSFGGDSLGFTIRINQDNRDYICDLKEGHSYKIRITAKESCMNAGTNFSYYTKNVVPRRNIDQPGLRVKRIINKANENSPEEVVRYYYTKKEDLSISSGVKSFDPVYHENRNDILLWTNRTRNNHMLINYNYHVITSSNVRGLMYADDIGSTAYSHVTVSYGGDNFENGGEEYKFRVSYPSQGYNVLGSAILDGPRNNINWDNGMLQRKIVFRKDVLGTNIPLSKETYIYEKDSRLNDIIHAGYTVRKRYPNNLTYADPTQNIQNLSIQYNRYYKTWQHISEQETVNYFNNGTDSLSTKTNFYYDNTNHLQQTSVETRDSRGTIIRKTTKYAHDVDNQRLIDDHRIAEPIETIVYKEDEKISHQKTVYSDTHNSSGLYLPFTIQASKGTQALEDRIVYHSYDESGNPQEVSKVDGPKIYYIWGYDKTQPIAKIEGYPENDISSVSTIIQECITASNNDIDQVSENTLRRKLSDLRTALSNAQVSTYTYDPLIGVTSITDPRGETIYYEYDEFNRLKFVKDSQENILKQHQYNYKNE